MLCVTTRTLYYYCSNHSGMGGNGYLSLTPRTDYRHWTSNTLDRKGIMLQIRLRMVI